jgi:hypothetical protein
LYSPNGSRQIIQSVRSDVIKSAANIIKAEDAAVAAGKDVTFYEAQQYRKFSIWRPLKKVERNPLAIYNPNTIDMEKNLAEHINKQPSNIKDHFPGLSMLRGNNTKSQKWY